MMRVPTLHLHWSVGEAETVIDFLDHLREQLLRIYGNQIAVTHRSDCSTSPADDRQLPLDLGDMHNCPF